MSILNNVTKQPPDHIKNTMVEIKLKIDAWIIPIPYVVALNCISAISIYCNNYPQSHLLH